MDINTRSHIIFITKIIVVAVIVFLGLTWGSQQVGYRLSNVPQDDFLSHTGIMYNTVVSSSGDFFIDDIVQTLYSVDHNTASSADDRDAFTQNFQIVCDEHTDLCSKITFVGDISSKDKYVYFSLIVYVVDALDKLIDDQFISLYDALDSITINTAGGLRRGGADRHNITINTQIISSYEEFFEVLTHEVGHIIDLGVIQGISRSKNYDYTEFGSPKFAADDRSIDFYTLSWSDEYKRTTLSYSSDFCSGYGMSNPFEDFAECINLYLNHNKLFRQWASDNDAIAKKYNLLAALFDNSYLFAGSKDISLLDFYDNGRRPWDTTRISY